MSLFEVISAVINTILDLTFLGDGLAAALGLIGIFVALVIMWAWTQHLVTEAALDIREWRQKRQTMKAVRAS